MIIYKCTLRQMKNSCTTLCGILVTTSVLEHFIREQVFFLFIYIFICLYTDSTQFINFAHIFITYQKTIYFLYYLLLSNPKTAGTCTSNRRCNSSFLDMLRSSLGEASSSDAVCSSIIPRTAVSACCTNCNEHIKSITYTFTPAI